MAVVVVMIVKDLRCLGADMTKLGFGSRTRCAQCPRQLPETPAPRLQGRGDGDKKK